HPEVDDPEAPELRGREVVARSRDQPDRIEGRDGTGGEEEEPGHVARMLAREPPSQDAPEHEYPADQPERQQDLPGAGQMQVPEALQAEPVRGGARQDAVEGEVGA